MQKGREILILVFLALVTAATLFAEGGQALQGVAAIVGAASPMVISAVQADAQKSIAKTQAASAKELAEISQETTLQLSKDNMETALMQAKSVEKMSHVNNAASTERLGLQLATTERLAMMKYARDERESWRLWDYKLRDLSYKEKAIEDDFRMKMRTLDLKLVSEGNAMGFVTPTYSSPLRTERILAAATQDSRAIRSPIVGQAMVSAYNYGLARGTTRTIARGVRRSSDLSLFQASMGPTYNDRDLIPHAAPRRGIASDASPGTSLVRGKTH